MAKIVILILVDLWFIYLNIITLIYFNDTILFIFRIKIDILFMIFCFCDVSIVFVKNVQEINGENLNENIVSLSCCYLFDFVIYVCYIDFR